MLCSLRHCKLVTFPTHNIEFNQQVRMTRADVIIKEYYLLQTHVEMLQKSLILKYFIDI